jgi:hypothetical protein
MAISLGIRWGDEALGDGWKGICCRATGRDEGNDKTAFAYSRAGFSPPPLLVANRNLERIVIVKVGRTVLWRRDAGHVPPEMIRLRNLVRRNPQ